MLWLVSRMTSRFIDFNRTALCWSYLFSSLRQRALASISASVPLVETNNPNFKFNKQFVSFQTVQLPYTVTIKVFHFIRQERELVHFWLNVTKFKLLTMLTITFRSIFFDRKADLTFKRESTNNKSCKPLIKPRKCSLTHRSDQL